MYKKFDEFLDRQQARSDQPTLSLRARQDQWLEALDLLYRSIDSFLAPYVKDGRLIMSSSQAEIAEEQLGRYSVPTRNIQLQGNGQAQARLEPVGAFIVGARGRVDLIGPTMRSVKLLLVPKDAARAGFNLQVRSSSDPPKPLPKAEGAVEWVWKIGGPPPELTYIELSDDSFLDALMDVLER